MSSLMFRIGAALACLRGDIQAPRRTLHWRRGGETVKFEMLGFKWFSTVNRYQDGKPAELFLVTAKTGDMLRSIVRDSAIAASLALQHGCPVETLRDAMGRSERGEPESPVAAALDLITGKELPKGI